jgi:hypothetical protein
MKLVNIKKEMHKVTDKWTVSYEGAYNISYSYKNVQVNIQHSGTDRATCALSVRNTLKPGDARYDDVGDLTIVYKLKHLTDAINTILRNTESEAKNVNGNF